MTAPSCQSPLPPRRPGVPRMYGAKPRKKNPYLYPVLLLSIGVIVAQMIWLQGNQHLFRPFSIERIKCDPCGGVGVKRSVDDQDVLVMCPACYGVGHHLVRRLDGDDNLCPPCMGLGRLEEEGRWRACNRCEGRGLIRSIPWSTRPEDMFEKTGQQLPEE